jgi:Zn-dependent protease with chaperone function
MLSHYDVIDAVRLVTEVVGYPMPTIDEADIFELLINGDTPNMAALGTRSGPDKIKYTPSLLKAVTADALLGITAHEVGHLVLKHSLKRRELFDANPVAIDWAIAGPIFRKHETEADDFAAELGLGKELALGLRQTTTWAARDLGVDVKELETKDNNEHPRLVDRYARLTREKVAA